MCDGDIQFCTNCKREIPRTNFIMHNVHCQRKLALCVKCDEPVPRCELAAHNTNFHAVVECPACGHQCEKRYLTDHQNSSCSHRAVCCNYCNIETEASELAEHENYCGSRTERCEDCGEFVMLKYQQLHQDSNHSFLKLEDEPGPTPLWSNAQATSTNLLNDLSRQRKVSNASQDSTRPTSASNRLSPSKRTNDMPQVNSATSAPPTKDHHKSAIPAVDDAVDLDRLLALRLVEQERMLSTIPSAPYVIDDGVPTQQGGELVALPCEFCQAMVPANQLVVHETGCRPDLASYGAAPLSPPSASSDEDEDIDGLPCEFCGVLFPPQFLLQHQDLCDAMPSLHHDILVNDVGPVQKADCRTTKKRPNLGPDTLHFFPVTSLDHVGDKNAYLNEVQAALKKPTASVQPIGHKYSSGSEFAQQNEAEAASCPSSRTSPGCANGTVRHSPSTGAVPKQKARRHVNTNEVSQEVPCSTATTVIPAGQLQVRHRDAKS